MRALDLGPLRPYKGAADPERSVMIMSAGFSIFALVLALLVVITIAVGVRSIPQG